MQIKDKFIAQKVLITNDKKPYTGTECNSGDKTIFDIPEGFSQTKVINLIKYVKENARNKINDTPLEIERKWITDAMYFQNILKMYPIENSYHIYQSYISINPELRFRRKRPLGSLDCKYFVDYKTDGDLVREEYSLDITDYNTRFSPAMAKFILDCLFIPNPIVKEYHRLILPDGKCLEISLVDGSWVYIEIEFNSESEAVQYNLPDNLNNIFTEVTEDPNYKMKNYWKRR